ncbi:MAG: Hsp70 family protein [Gammaproteobacteria bacterium]
MNVRGYIGIDFGTTNSHFASAVIDEAKPRAEPIALGNRHSNATCVLWKKPAVEENDILAIGDVAVESWLFRDEEEREHYHFSASFKPDISVCERARKDAWAFLRKAYLEMREHRTPGNIGHGEGMPVVVGVPAEISEAQQRTTAQVASEAGFGKVECVPEPLGALAYHLAHGQITDEEAQEGVIVIDFGGGTLDVALVDKEGIKEPWGNPNLGGRLFDDLFFQWVLDKNPGIDLTEFSEDELMAGWCCGGRELKERFSQHWKLRGVNQDFNDFKLRLSLAFNRQVGRPQGASLAEFKERARTYCSSDVARRYFEAVGRNLNDLGVVPDRPVDLYALIREALSNNGRIDRLARRFSLVVLTGGSSNWPFMAPLAAEVFGVAPDRIIASASPEVTIGQGLAIYNVIRHRHRSIRERITGEKVQRKKALEKRLAKKLQGFGEQVAQAVSSQLMPQMRPAYLEWYRSGGSLLEVETRVKEICSGFNADRIVAEQSVRLTDEVRQITLDFVSSWLKEHGANPRSETLRVVLSGGDTSKSPQEWDISDAMGEGVASSFTQMLAGVVAVIGGALAGGGGAALITTGPIGWIIGAVLAGGAVFGLHETIKERLKTWPFTGKWLWVLHQVVSEKDLLAKLEDAEATLRASLAKRIVADMETHKRTLIGYLDESIDEVIKKFSILEHLSSLER